MPKISQEKMQQRRQEILNKAFEVFSDKGYSQASMEDIVKHSGISKGGIYTHFKSKEEIFLAIADQCFELSNDLFSRMAEVETVSEKISMYIHWNLDGLKDEATRMGARFAIEFWSIISRDASKAYISKNRYDYFEKDLEELLLEGIQKGEFRSDLNTKNAAYIIMSAMDGITTTDAVVGVKIREEIVNDFIQMVLSYLRG
ncbi:MAG: TetR/AcrR family transcriptional regulator [Bacillota bacterium]